MWTTPKTNWTIEDSFNIEDFNRIKNNIEYLHEKACLIWSDFEIDDMGTDLVSYDGYWNIDYFNAIENNIDILDLHMLNENYGYKQTFRANAIFITYAELNRIESAIERMYKIVNGYEKAKFRFPFRLGGLKGVKA